MAAKTIDRTGFPLFSHGTEVAGDAVLVGRQPHGDAVFFTFLFVAVAAGALFALGIEDLFRFGVVFVMAFFALVVRSDGMAVMEGLVKSHGQPVGRHRPLDVTFTAFHRTAFLVGGRQLRVA